MTSFYFQSVKHDLRSYVNSSLGSYVYDHKCSFTDIMVKSSFLMKVEI